MKVGEEDAGAACCPGGSGCNSSSDTCSSNSSSGTCGSNSSTSDSSGNTGRSSKSCVPPEGACGVGANSSACSEAGSSSSSHQSSSSNSGNSLGNRSSSTSPARSSSSSVTSSNCSNSILFHSSSTISATNASASSSSSGRSGGDANPPAAGDLVWPALKITFYEAVLQQLISDNLLDTARSLASTLRLRSIPPFAKDHLYRVYLQTLFLPPAAAAACVPTAARAAAAEAVTAEAAPDASSLDTSAPGATAGGPPAAAAGADLAPGLPESTRGAAASSSSAPHLAGSADGVVSAGAAPQQSATVAGAAEAPSTAATAAAEGDVGAAAAAAAQGETGGSASSGGGAAAALFPRQPWVPLQTRAVLPPAACKSGSVRLLSYGTDAASAVFAAADRSGNPYRQTTCHGTQPEQQQQQEEQEEQQQRGAAAPERTRRRSSSSSVDSLRAPAETALVEEVRASITFQAPCISAACSPDLRLVAGGSRDATVRIMDVAPTRSLRMRVYHGHIGPVTALALHPSRDLCFSGSTDCSVKIYDVSSKSMRSSSSAGLPIASFQDAHAIECLTVHPCGDFLYVGTTHPIIRLYDLQTSRCFTCLAAAAHQQQRICDLRCSADGAVLASASADGTIHFFDAVDGKLVNRIPAAHSGMPVTSVRWSRTGRYLLSSGVDGQSRIWDVRNGKQVLVMGEGIRGRSPKTVATFLSNEAYIAHMSLGVVGGLRYYSAYTGSEVINKNSSCLNAVVNALESAPLEMTLVIAASDAKTRLVHLHEGEAERDLEMSTA